MVTKKGLIREVKELREALAKMAEANAALSSDLASASSGLSALKEEVEGLKMLFEDPSRKKGDPVANYVRGATDFSAGHSFHPNEDYRR